MKIPFCHYGEDSSVGDWLKDHGLSRSRLKKAALKKAFLEKGLHQGDQLEIDLDLMNYGLINPSYQGPDITVLYEDENFVVLDKPADIYCHPLSYLERNNCLSFLRRINRVDILEVNNKSYDRGLLYRLDVGTSGVLVLAKGDELYRMLRKNYHLAVSHKQYLAIVEGVVAERVTLRHHLMPSGKAGSKMKITDDGVNAVVHIRPIKKMLDGTLISVLLEGGLRHQIRAQLAGIGHPLLGDTLYGGPEADRLYLHAFCYRIDFENIKAEFISRGFRTGGGDLLNLDGDLEVLLD